MNLRRFIGCRYLQSRCTCCLSRRKSPQRGLRPSTAQPQSQQFVGAYLSATGGIFLCARPFKNPTVPGKLAEARVLMAPIYGWFTEGFDYARTSKEAKRQMSLW
jgi:hypothetical protein